MGGLQRVTERDTWRDEKTEGRRVDQRSPQISPAIVSQSLAESRQAIHRRRAET